MAAAKREFRIGSYISAMSYELSATPVKSSDVAVTGMRISWRLQKWRDVAVMEAIRRPPTC